MNIFRVENATRCVICRRAHSSRSFGYYVIPDRLDVRIFYVCSRKCMIKRCNKNPRNTLEKKNQYTRKGFKFSRLSAIKGRQAADYRDDSGFQED